MGATTFYLLEKERRERDAKRTSEQGNEERSSSEAEQEKALEDFTVKELKELAEQQNIEGYSSMKKAELIEALEG